MITVRRLRENLQDSEIYYDKNREVVFKFKDKLLEIHESTVPEKGPVVIEFREASGTPDRFELFDLQPEVSIFTSLDKAKDHMSRDFDKICHDMLMKENLLSTDGLGLDSSSCCVLCRDGFCVKWKIEGHRTFDGEGRR